MKKSILITTAAIIIFAASCGDFAPKPQTAGQTNEPQEATSPESQTPREQTILNLFGQPNLDFESDDNINYWTDGFWYLKPCSTNPNQWMSDGAPVENIAYFYVGDLYGIGLGLKIQIDEDGKMTVFESGLSTKGNRVEHRIIGADTLLIFSDVRTRVVNVFKKFDGNLEEKIRNDYRRYLLAGEYQHSNGGDRVVFADSVVSGLLSKGMTLFTFVESGMTPVNILAFYDTGFYKAEKTLTGLELTPLKTDPDDDSDWIEDLSESKIILVKTDEWESGLPVGTFPFVSTQVMTLEELKRYAGRFDDEMYRHLQIMRNEILARHGQKFAADSEPAKHFSAQAWYKPQYDDVTSKLTEIERINIALIQILEP